MALYEYRCSECEERFELMRSISAADEPAACPECGAMDSRRLISNFAPGATAVSKSSSTATIPVRKVGGHGGCGCC